MASLSILRMGHPTLRQTATALAPLPGGTVDAPTRQLAQDMIDAMLAAPGVGLAAPQVGIARRMIVFRVPAGRSGQADIAPQALIDPQFEPLDDVVEDGWEACLSIPGLCGLVPRYRNIRYWGLDLDSCPVERQASGFHARVIQHELDHLDGILYPDRMPDLSRLGFVDEIRRAEIQETPS